MSEETILSKEIADEALCPDASQDTFQIAGKTVKIKPLTVFHQIEFTKILNSVLKDVAYYLDEESWANVAAEVTAHPEILPKLIYIICQNDSTGITEEDILNQAEVDLMDMLQLIVRLAEKNQKIGKPVLDFFSKAWPLIKKNLAGKAELGLIALQKEVEDTATILLNLSASDMENSPAKSR